MAKFKQYEKKDGKKAWLFQVYLGKDETTGKDIRTTRRGVDTQSEAKRAMNKLVVEYQENGKSKKDIKITFEEVYKEWFQQYKRNVKGVTAYYTKKLFENNILEKFGKLYITNIDLGYCQKQANIWGEKFFATYVMLDYIGKVFEYAIKNGYATENPMKLVDKPKKKTINQIDEQNDSDKFYTKEELKTFLECAEKNCGYKYFAIFRGLAFSGMRIGKTIVTTPKTKNSRRILSMDNETMNILKKWKKEQQEILKGNNILKYSDKEQIVFSNKNNKYTSYTGVTYVKNQLASKNGLKRIKIHGFRHTHCSLLFEANTSIKEVQKRLGHKGVATTMNVYTHLTDKQQEQTMQKFVDFVRF
jgi:Site-specific recombinase XerD